MALTQVQAAGLAADLIDETKLADNSIDSEHYNDGSIDNAHLADDAVGIDELSATGTASSSTFLRGDNSWVTPTDTNTQLSTEEVQDIVGAMFTGNTETNITATYEDSDGTIDLVSTDTNTQLSTEEVQDIVGAMFTGNTETNITATYEDSDGTIDLVVAGSDSDKIEEGNTSVECTDSGEGYVSVNIDGAEQVRFNDGGQGQIIVGDSGPGTTTSIDSETAMIQCNRREDSRGGILHGISWGGSGPRITLGKSGSTTVGTASACSDGDSLGALIFTGDDGTSFKVGAKIQAIVDAGMGSSDLPCRLAFYTTPDATSSPVERVRIRNNGEFRMGSGAVDEGLSSYATSTPGYWYTAGAWAPADIVAGTQIVSTAGLCQILNRTSDGHTVIYRKSGSSKGNVYIDSTSTTYNTSSDYRLKENETPISDGITRIKQLKPYRFNFKVTPSKVQDGFFAHEVSPVVPESIHGEKDAMHAESYYEDGDTLPSGKKVGDVKTYSSTEIDPQVIDHSQLVPLLTAALQEAIIKIETLETKVAALEAG